MHVVGIRPGDGVERKDKPRPCGEEKAQSIHSDNGSDVSLPPRARGDTPAEVVWIGP